MSFIQPFMLIALPMIALPIIIHLINQRRYQTRRWGAMMFLLTANRMNRGLARVRQWLILAMRTLAIAALIFAIARPLASGLLGITGGGNVDTTIVLLDRSPSMQELSVNGTSKLETGRRQLADALGTLGSDHWVAVDSADNAAQSFESLDALMSSAAMQPSSATAELPAMMQAALDYLEINKSGATEVWICSDLQESDWNAESGTWSVVREGFEHLPQSVRFHLLAYSRTSDQNLAIRVTDVRREAISKGGTTENNLLISMRLSRSLKADAVGEAIEIPLHIEIDGKRSELSVQLTGNQAEIRQHRVVLSKDQIKGWGRVSIPADSQNEDNEFYFVFDEPPTRRVVVVSEDREATRPLEIAAAVSADGTTNSTVDVHAPDQLDSLVLDQTSLLLWQTMLPDSSTSPAVTEYINRGGQVIFFPPSKLTSGASGSVDGSFFGVGWQGWVNKENKVMVESWRGDQDLFAATNSGAGLPVGQLELSGYAKLSSNAELSTLATLTGGEPLLAKVSSERGGVYFMTASPDSSVSTLASSGIVLFVAVQRAIERGQQALGNTSQRTAGESTEPTANWRQVAGRSEALSTEYGSQAGIYESDDRLFAINRSLAEDQKSQLDDGKVESLFAGLPFAKMDDSAGSLTGIVREVWRLFLISMIIALLFEAVLCMPRAQRGPV